MVAQKTFGRRPSTDVRPRFSTAGARRDAAVPGGPSPIAAQALPHARTPAQVASAADIGPSLRTSEDLEFAAWKKERARGPRLPWRQLSFIASLCFGVASFVLPDKVNDLVNWLLYALMAASFYIGWTARRSKKAE